VFDYAEGDRSDAAGTVYPSGGGNGTVVSSLPDFLVDLGDGTPVQGTSNWDGVALGVANADLISYTLWASTISGLQYIAEEDIYTTFKIQTGHTDGSTDLASGAPLAVADGSGAWQFSLKLDYDIRGFEADGTDNDGLVMVW
jgi:hypothetical protein